MWMLRCRPFLSLAHPCCLITEISTLDTNHSITTRAGNTFMNCPLLLNKIHCGSFEAHNGGAVRAHFTVWVEVDEIRLGH